MASKNGITKCDMIGGPVDGRPADVPDDVVEFTIYGLDEGPLGIYKRLSRDTFIWTGGQ